MHLANHDVLMMAVSRAPIDAIQAYKQRMGWTFPWASSHDDEFNYDFNVSVTEEQQRGGPVDYNFGERDMRPFIDATEGGRVPSRLAVRHRRATYSAKLPA